MNNLIQGSDLKYTPHLPHDEGGPVFAAPWEAKAFAMAVSLHKKGVFDWNEWCEALSREIKIAQAEGDPDLGNSYYEHWLRALEKLIAAKKLTTAQALLSAKEDWRAADHHRGFGEAPVLVKGAGTGDHHQ